MGKFRRIGTPEKRAAKRKMLREAAKRGGLTPRVRHHSKLTNHNSGSKARHKGVPTRSAPTPLEGT